MGTLIIKRRRYTINNQTIDFPGHIGIVTNTTNGLDMIHANSKSGKVEEVPVGDSSTTMGYLAVNLYNHQQRKVS